MFKRNQFKFLRHGRKILLKLYELWHYKLLKLSQRDISRQIIDKFSTYAMSTYTTIILPYHDLLGVDGVRKVLAKPLSAYKICSYVDLYSALR